MEPAKPAKPTYVGSKRRRKKSTGSLKEGQQRRATSEGQRRYVKKRDVSKDSTGSSAMSLDVRCACQYFQCDSLLPDRVTLVGTRPNSRTSNMVTRNIGDHEYEPVNPPPDNVSPLASAPPAPQTVHIINTDQGTQQKTISLASSTTSLERRMLGAEIEPHPEESFTVQEMQTQIESKFFSKTPETSKPETTVHTSQTTTTVTEKQPAKSEGPGKFQQAVRNQAGKLKTKLHGIKKPNIKLPSKPKITKPNFEKFKFEKPKFSLPKLPDTAKINLPTFSLPRRNPLKRSLKERQLSTESNAGDSKKNYFDFKTYPRLFKKKPQKDDFDSFSSKSEREVPEFATVPRTKRNKAETDRWGGRDTIRIPLHPEDSVEDNDREDSVERRMASHMRYEQDIDIDDAYEKENQEIHAASPFSHYYNSRWEHGSFHPEPNLEFRDNSKNRQVTDLDSPGDGPAPNESFDTNTSKDMHSSESSLGIHRRGVLEEIDSDEFFLRQKGISQDNIEVGWYLSSEIREAFKSPTNALAELQRDEYQTRESNQSLPETQTKRKVVKKPKRKKTPHVSQEQIVYDQDSEQELGEIPPSRPKRRSKRNRKPKESKNVVPYQETIAVDASEENLGILGNPREYHEEYRVMYENEQMQGKEQPEINIVEPYPHFNYDEKYDSDEEVFGDEPSMPEAPPRKHRSLKSLNFSEHDSIIGDFNLDRPHSQEVEVYKIEHEYIIPTPEIPPTKPPRTLSRSSSKSQDQDEIHEKIEETPIRPTRSRSLTRSRADSLTTEEPCIEESCVQDFRDNMGYAVIDKQTKREPPLPPPRTPPRRKRSVQSTKSAVSEQKFFTVPRPLNDEAPTRPMRNYSTLGPSRPPRRKPPLNMTDEEKENIIDITQYIEIEDEPNRDLHSGEVIQKMRDRPLPAPPRPPRKSRTLHDITSEENIAIGSQDIEKPEDFEETEISTQTELLPDDFVSEEVLREEPDNRGTSTKPQSTEQSEEDLVPDPTEEKKKKVAPAKPQIIEHPDVVTIETRLITPTHYTFEETVTHGSLLIEPLNGAKILPDSDISARETPTERTVPIVKDYDDDETSEIPEEFTKLKDPTPVRSVSTPQPSIIERIIERPVVLLPDSNTEIEILRAQKLQVSDLDVDRLSVNELLASKIIVSEIDSANIMVNELSSKSGALKIGEIELPPGIVQQLFEKLQSVAQEQQSQSAPTTSKPVAETSTKKEDDEETGQKKTPIEEITVETLPQRPPRNTEETSVTQIDDSIEESQTVDVDHTQTDLLNNLEIEETTEPPEPPIRSDSSIKPKEIEPVLDASKEAQPPSERAPQRPPRHAEKFKTDESDAKEEQQQMEEPDVDDEPPPRPPQPQVSYIPSQPPASFYELRAQQYIDSLEGDIPMAPRRRRHHKPPISRSSSDESPAPPASRRRYRSPEPTIPQLTGQLIQACGSAANSSIKRLIAHITNNVLRNSDGQQDLHVMMVILLVLIAGLILLGYGDGKTVHYHHWEYFNPPRDT